ncbi:Threonine aldolase [Serendipita sp. 411]|nr:Threonine aldolase [Serendipita sp. 411]
MSNKTLSDAQRAIIDVAKLDLMEHSPNRISQDAERRSLARNFCSDTVTAPSAEMLKFAMKATSVGDDVFGWDYCTNALEQHMAKICGKEAAIFVSSGTMGNQIALRCLFERPPYSLCFSKGLGTPAGSILVGPSDLITLARRYRKLFGGGMRQTGILSACAAYALNHHIALLPSVHSKAKRLADGLSKIGVGITEPTETCMVWFDPSSVGLTTHQIGKRAAQLEQPIMIFESNRLVVHIQTSDEAIDDFLNLVQAMAEEHKGGKLRVDGTSRSTHYPARL